MEGFVFITIRGIYFKMRPTASITCIKNVVLNRSMQLVHPLDFQVISNVLCLRLISTRYYNYTECSRPKWHGR